MKKHIFLSIVCLAAFQTIGFAQWSPDPRIGLPVDTSPSYHTVAWSPKVPQSDGFTCIWTEGNKTSRENLYVRQYNRFGVPLWGPKLLVDSSSYRPTYCLEGDGRGNVIVAWNQRETNDPIREVHIQKYDPLGNEMWGPRGIVASQQELFFMTTDERGGVFVSLSTLDTLNGGFSGSIQHVDSTGRMLWPKGGVRTIGTGEVVSDGRGGAILSWQRYPDYLGTRVQRIDAEGHVLWSPNGVEVDLVPAWHWSARIVADGRGGAIVAWYDKRGLGDNPFGLYIQRIDSTGLRQWTPDGILVESHLVTGIGVHGYAMAPDGKDGAIIASARDGWYDPDSSVIRFQRISANGDLLWDYDKTATPTFAGWAIGDTWESPDPKAVSDGAGGAIIVYDNFLHGWRNRDIYAQRVDANGNLLWAAGGVPVSTADSMQSLPQIVGDGREGAYVWWRDARRRTENNDLYAARICANGTLAPCESFATIPCPSGDPVPAGTEVNIPINLESAAKLTASNALTFRAQVRFNKSVLLPQMPILESRIEGEDCVIIFRGNRAPDFTQGTLTVMPFVAVLGDAACSTVHVDSLWWEDGTSPIVMNNAYCEVCVKVCEAGGPRLFQAAGRLALKQNRPNPFNAQTAIDYEVIEQGFTELTVTDMLGRRVTTLFSGIRDAGKYTAQYDASTLSTGTYMYQLQTPSARVVKFMEVVK
jgi:hypothetical protein